MQVVIEIPEVYYEALKNTDEIISGQRSGKTLMSVIYNAVANGTPLPKNHGDLIDRYNLLDNAGRYNYKNFQVITVARIMAEDVVIPAESEE